MNTSRRKYLGSTTWTLLGSAIPLAGTAQPHMHVRVGYALPTTSHYGAGANAWADAVDQATAGRIKFKHFSAGEIGGEREMLQGLRLGLLDAAILSTGSLGNVVPEIGVVDTPFLFRNAKHARAVLDGMIGQDIQNKFIPKGLYALAWGEQGFRHLTNNRRSVQSPSDFQGLKIRTMENQALIAAFRELGARPTSMVWPEVVTGLRKGTIDGQESPISVIVSTKLAQLQRHLTLTGHFYSTTIFFVSKQFWEGLTATDKERFANGAKAGAIAMRTFVDSVEAKGIAELSDAGMQIVTGIDYAAFQRSLAHAYKQYERRFGSALIERIRSIQ
jgi:TRAP-type transport system periplasmic protein